MIKSKSKWDKDQQITLSNFFLSQIVKDDIIIEMRKINYL